MGEDRPWHIPRRHGADGDGGAWSIVVLAGAPLSRKNALIPERRCTACQVSLPRGGLSSRLSRRQCQDGAGRASHHLFSRTSKERIDNTMTPRRWHRDQLRFKG